jgi:protein TonB
MNGCALHLPERHGFRRWTFAAAIIVAAHAAIIASIALRYVRKPPPVHMLPAINVTLAPVEAAAPQIQNQDIAVGPTMQQAPAARKQPPKAEDKPVEQVVQPPPPQKQAEVTLPTTQKPIEKPKPVYTPPAPETRAPPKTAHIGVFTLAGSNAYNALVFGHLQRFKRYPRGARGAHGTVVVRFELNRKGDVIASRVTKSSGYRVLDEEALAILRRASPFPSFPAAKPGADDFWTAPIAFARN